MSCLLCFSSDKPTREEMKGKYGDTYAPFLDNHNTYQVSLCRAPCARPCAWSLSMILMPCSQVYMRRRALNHVSPGSGWSNYICCQGYFGGCCCVQPGSLGEQSCPVPCMCLEAVCCPGLAVSATSFVVREQYDLGLDEDDVRLIKLNNCLFCFATVLNCVSIFVDWDGEQECVQIVNLVSDVVFCCTSGCMLAQVYNEVAVREEGGDVAPRVMAMER